MQSNYVRYESVRLIDYGVFAGTNELNFDRHRTLIAGDNGTGKSTIANVLANLGPAGINANLYVERPQSSVDVITKGNRDLIKEYGSVIFLGCESAVSLTFNKEDRFADILDRQQREMVKHEAHANFQVMVSQKPWKIEAHKDLKPEYMATGERVCFCYALAFAVRKVLGLDLPVVFDAPYVMLDWELRHGLYLFLKEQSCQQILLGVDREFSSERKPHYTLDHRDSYSRVNARMARSYFISPDITLILHDETSHIEMVAAYPEKFGMTSEEIRTVYDKYGEPVGAEGVASEEIVEKLIIEKGWIRIQEFDGFWQIFIGRLTDKVKNVLRQYARLMIDGDGAFGIKKVPKHYRAMVVPLAYGKPKEFSFSMMAHAGMMPDLHITGLRGYIYDERINNDLCFGNEDLLV